MKPVDTTAKRLGILESARKLLVKYGFQDLTLDEVAREAGVAKGTLFLYFKSKDELFSAAFAELADQLGRRLEEIARTPLPGARRLDETARAILSHLDRNRDFMSHIGAGRFPACGAKSSARLMDKFRENNRRVARILTLCARDGVPLGRRDFVFESAVLFGLCRSAMMERFMRDSDGPLAGAAGKVVAFFLRGALGKT